MTNEWKIQKRYENIFHILDLFLYHKENFRKRLGIIKDLMIYNLHDIGLRNIRCRGERQSREREFNFVVVVVVLEQKNVFKN